MFPRFFFAFLLVAQFSDGLELDLHRDDPKQLEMLRQGKFAEFRQWKENHQQSLMGRFSNLASGKSTIQEYDGRAYKVNVTVGTPPQNFMLYLNVFTPDTMILDKAILGLYNASISDKLDTFDSSKSSTYINDGRTFVGANNTVQGFCGIDTLVLGNHNEIDIKNATFGQLTKLIVDPEFFTERFDGVLGLGIEKGGIIDAEPIFLTAIRENVVDKPIYTTWIDRNSPDTLEPKGLLTIGNLDTDHCDSNVVYVPILEDWLDFKIDGYSLNSGNKQATNWTAISDISGYFNSVPQDLLDAIVQETQAQYDPQTGLYIVDCGTKFEMSFFSSNTQLTVDEKTSVVRLNDFNSCYLAFESWDGEPNIVFGEPFSLAYCTIHDASGNGRIGFAKNL